MFDGGVHAIAMQPNKRFVGCAFFIMIGAERCHLARFALAKCAIRERKKRVVDQSQGF
jgi:hypothetical protein